MRLGYTRGQKLNQQFDLLGACQVDEIFSDGKQNSDIIQAHESDFQRLLEYAESGDCLVIAFLEVISRDYRQLLEFLDELEERNLELMVLTSSDLTLMDWREVLTWVNRNDKLVHPRVIKLKVKQGGAKNNYSVFSREPEAKQLYREIIWQLIGKQKIQRIARENGVPIGTVYRIQQEFKRIKLAAVFAVCFFLAIATIKLSESFSDNLFIQIMVCIVTTVIVLYNTLVDSEQS